MSKLSISLYSFNNVLKITPKSHLQRKYLYLTIQSIQYPLSKSTPFILRKQSLVAQPRRYLNVHENSAYSLLKAAGIPTPPYGVARTPEEAAEIAKKLDSRDLVLKAQVLAGGRGKGKFIRSNVSGVVMCET